jgi:hypothetical protein
MAFRGRNGVLVQPEGGIVSPGRNGVLVQPEGGMVSPGRNGVLVQPEGGMISPGRNRRRNGLNLAGMAFWSNQKEE